MKDRLCLVVVLLIIYLKFRLPFKINHHRNSNVKPTKQKQKCPTVVIKLKKPKRTKKNFFFHSGHKKSI